LDVYEKEEQTFFEDRSGLILSDDVFARLLTFPNVIITGHQAFFTREAFLNIADTTIENIDRFEQDQPLEKLAGYFRCGRRRRRVVRTIRRLSHLALQTL